MATMGMRSRDANRMIFGTSLSCYFRHPKISGPPSLSTEAPPNTSIPFEQGLARIIPSNTKSGQPPTGLVLLMWL